MVLPSVLVFTPIYDGKEYCLEDFLQHARKINYPNFRHIFVDNSDDGGKFSKKLQDMGLDVIKVERGKTSREALTRAQLTARQIALEDNYDYLMSLESDIMHPTNIIQLLLENGKRVISALYLIGMAKEGIRIPCITLPEYNKTLRAWGTRLLEPKELNDYLHKGVRRVQAAGMGCCLIRRDVFERISFYFDPRFSSHSDVYFFNSCFDAHIPVFVDTDILLEHKNSDWTKVKDR